ncbi:Uncharacterized conserved protein, DUF433 family [Candidatus Fervidibacteria bacterium JGI MDM2 JNZ-1-D12]
MAKANKQRQKLVREIVGGEVYEYVPLGKYIVSAKGVCGGRPTFKYTRVEVRHILDLLAHGWTVEQIVNDFNRPEISREAIEEAMKLAAKALERWADEVGKAA